jgi:hypothetical protein
MVDFNEDNPALTVVVQENGDGDEGVLATHLDDGSEEPIENIERFILEQDQDIPGRDITLHQVDELDPYKGGYRVYQVTDPELVKRIQNTAPDHLPSFLEEHVPDVTCFVVDSKAPHDVEDD